MAEEPLTVQEVKDALHIDHDDDDAVIARLITTARLAFEKETGRAVVERTELVRYNLDTRARGRLSGPVGTYRTVLMLPYPPLQTVDQIEVLSDPSTRTWEVLDPSNYAVEAADGSGRARVYMLTMVGWPYLFGDATRYRITLTVGYPSRADVPDDIKTALIAWVSKKYERPEVNPADFNYAKVPHL